MTFYPLMPSRMQPPLKVLSALGLRPADHDITRR